MASTTNKGQGQNSQLKAYCLEKALEAYRYNQQISVIDLAVQFEKYLSSLDSSVNLGNTPST